MSVVKKIFALVALSLVVAACSQSAESVDSAPPHAADYSAVSTSNPDFKPAAGTKVAWFKDIIVADELSDVKVKPEQAKWAQQRLSEEVKKRGYTIVADKDDADYFIAAAIILDNSHEADRLQELTHMFPHLNTQSGMDHKGSLVMVITKPGYQTINSLMWRSAIQAYVLGDKISADQSRDRTEMFIQRLVSSMPVAAN
ncbi:hypothetical protein [Agaribacterium haliotis]|uniref:hypothetical protein n=1 Tax=Agaribacterium haliotis TaxID=2013869 RepID=UPI000BB53E40|nr:hypothetical protein [Agaribacterium haliotis]